MNPEKVKVIYYLRLKNKLLLFFSQVNSFFSMIFIIFCATSKAHIWECERRYELLAGKIISFFSFIVQEFFFFFRAFSIFSGVIGSSFIHTPVAFAIAWATAAKTGKVAPSPTSLAP